MSQYGAEVDLVLDELEREAKPRTFAFAIGDRRIPFEDPAELDWQDLEKIEGNSDFLHLALSEEDREYFMDQKIPAWKMETLYKRYMDHYDLGDSKKA